MGISCGAWDRREPRIVRAPYPRPPQRPLGQQKCRKEAQAYPHPTIVHENDREGYHGDL